MQYLEYLLTMKSDSEMRIQVDAGTENVDRHTFHLSSHLSKHFSVVTTALNK